MTARRAWAEGDEGWEVEWCKHMPHYEDDPVNAEMVTRDFRDKDAAYAYAAKAYPKGVTGVVCITPFILERLCDEDRFHPTYNCHTEYTADTDYYEGDR